MQITSLALVNFCSLCKMFWASGHCFVINKINMVICLLIDSFDEYKILTLTAMKVASTY